MPYHQKQWDQGVIPHPRKQWDEGEEAITEMNSSSSTTFLVMNIVSDKQELGFVEKVHVPEAQIAQICKHLVPSSIDARNPEDIKINYQMLNMVSLPTVGMYGDKLMVARLLKNIRAINDSTYSKMLQGKLEAGLYVSPTPHCMVAFYWHEGSHMEEAARKQMSCNFIRYLVDLCDDVCVLVEEDNLMEVLSASALRQKQKYNRTTRIKVSRVQNTANDVHIISAGFRVALGLGSEIMGLHNQKALFAVPIPGPFFSQGRHRCGFISPAFRKSRVYTRRQPLSVDASKLPSKIKEWYQDYAVDFSRLGNADFILFLKHSGLLELQTYEKFENSIKSRLVQEQRQLNVTSRLQQVEDKIFVAFMKALPEIYSFFKYLPDWASEEAAGGGRGRSCFEKLEQVVADVWGGSKVVFVGSEITVRYSNGLSFKGLIESVRGESSCGPITSGQKFRLLKEFQETPACFLKDFPSQERTAVSVGESIVLAEEGRSSRTGVITEVQTPSEAIRSWVEEVVTDSLQKSHENFIFLCFVMSKGIAEELKDLGEGFIANIGRETYFGRKVLQQLLADVGASNHHQQKISLDCKQTKEFVLYGNTSIVWQKLDNAASSLQADAWRNYEQCKKKFMQFKLDERAVSNVNLFMDDWKTLCREVSDSLKDTVRKSIVSMIGRNMTPFLQKRFEKTEEEERRLLQKRLKGEEDEFLKQMKHDLTRGGDGGKMRRMYIQGCKTTDRFFLNIVKKGDARIEIAVSTEEMENPGIVWRYTEVAPTKRDLDQISVNPMHKINPLCSQPFELLTIDPQNEELKMVASLKSGELLGFVLAKSGENRLLNVYVAPKLGSVITGMNPIRSFRRGTDLIAFEESTRFLALYDAQVSKVSIYRFDDVFRQADFTGVELSLDAFSGSSNLVWMLCVPGKSELLLLDDTKRIRIAELHHVPLMKPGQAILPSECICGCISEDGTFLFLLLKPGASSSHGDDDDDKGVKPRASQSNENRHFPKVSIYALGDTISLLKCISLDNVSLQDVSDLEMKLVNYGRQRHLVVFSKSKPDVLMSYVLEITLATEVLNFREKLKSEQQEEAANDASVKSSPALEYLYHIYDKFAVHPPLCRETGRSLNFHVLLKPDSVGSNGEAVIDKCNKYITSLFTRIEREKGKDFLNYRFHLHIQTVDRWESGNTLQSCLARAQKKVMGDWMRQLVCLVPVQICRADNNAIQPLVDGLQISSQATYADTISLANLLRFGMYDSVLNQWDGTIKVISSMGKQSSGKSFLLNHLSGSLLDVAGGRCTDGVWLTVRVVSNCLYVIMDFEGLGSFERTEQEDVLLSVLNAAMSNLTIFNKKDFHLDKETEILFNRFQEGVSLVKHDEKLFKGLFYVAIKDVDASDVEELKEEFYKKLQQICERSKEDFLSKMYNGDVVIAAMPPFTRQEYHKESLEDIACTIEELDGSFQGGRSFLRDLKLVIAQIAAKDWTPVDVKRVALKIEVLRKNVVTAVKSGCLLSKECLVNFDTDEEIPDSGLEVGDLKNDVADTGLELAVSEGSTNSAESILGSLRRKFEQVLERRGIKDEEWHAKFQEFLQALAKRRQQRVQNWVSCNTREFADNNEVQKLQLEVTLALAEVNQEMAVCGGKCSKCFWKCVLNKGHSSDDSCMGSHVCAEKCSYCSLELVDEADEAKVSECQCLAGHEGSHDCRKKNHTCEKPCAFSTTSSNCSIRCSLKVNHTGAHRCGTPQHICNRTCSLPGCQNCCVIQVETGDHDKHVCHERYCPEKCVMKGCNRRCGVEDHFHKLKSSEHLCGNQHPCPEKCQAEGICEILTELLRQKRQFAGKRGTFEYDHVSEQNGLRKDCCIPVPPFKLCHEGAHVHTLKPNVVHYCDVKCPACGYFCDLHFKHPGLHKTVHGNMRLVKFSADEEKFDIQNRKYEWGESGLAEMCNMHCKAQGRGHIHLIKCSALAGDPKYCTIKALYNGARHQTKKYGPDLDVPKDEITHETYWLLMRFQDPCCEEDRKEFGLCNHECKSNEHVAEDGKRTPSFCTEKLWHQPLKTPRAAVASVGGHVTQDGHAFTCKHGRGSLHHVVFVADASSSMWESDCKPQMAKFSHRFNNRLGCVLEAILRFVVTRRKTVPSGDIMSVVFFSNQASMGVDTKPLLENGVDELLSKIFRGYGTSYWAGLKLAHDVLLRGCRHGNYSNLKPVVIFLSDGGNTDSADPVPFVAKMLKDEPRCIVHTIMFGKDPYTETLKKMAVTGKGTFNLSIDQVALAKSFECLAESLKPTVAALM